MLITAGTTPGHRDFNTMTAAWGGFGVLWHKKVSFCFVRPTRYTYEFMEKNEFYTLSFFPDRYKEALNVLGTQSGRDTDKVKTAGLTPFTIREKAIAFDEARLILVCNKSYYHDLDPRFFLDETIDGNYPQKDYHRMYVGEIIAAYRRTSA